MYTEASSSLKNICSTRSPKAGPGEPPGPRAPEAVSVARAVGSRLNDEAKSTWWLWSTYTTAYANNGATSSGTGARFSSPTSFAAYARRPPRADITAAQVSRLIRLPASELREAARSSSSAPSASPPRSAMRVPAS